MTTDNDTIHADLHFLSKDRIYNSEKPYTMRFPPHIAIPQSNIHRETHNVTIRSLRPYLGRLSLDQCGFDVMSLKSQMSYKDFGDDSKISSLYLEELRQAFQSTLGASHIYVTDYTVGCYNC